MLHSLCNSPSPLSEHVSAMAILIPPLCCTFCFWSSCLSPLKRHLRIRLAYITSDATSPRLSTSLQSTSCMTKVFSVGAGRRDRFVHASRRAPRCLPCNYTDPLEDTGVGAAINRFNAVKACPCTLEALCKGTDNTHIINSWDCRFTKWRPAWWYFAHVRPSRTSNFLSELCMSTVMQHLA